MHSSPLRSSDAGLHFRCLSFCLIFCAHEKYAGVFGLSLQYLVGGLQFLICLRKRFCALIYGVPDQVRNGGFFIGDEWAFVGVSMEYLGGCWECSVGGFF